MIRRGLSSLMVIIMLLHTANNLSYLVKYHVFIDLYKALCINNDKPEMQCNGHCQLKKELFESLSPEANQQENAPKNEKEEHSINFFSQSSEVDGSHTPYLLNNYSRYYLISSYQVEQRGVFHPPCIG